MKSIHPGAIKSSQWRDQHPGYNLLRGSREHAKKHGGQPILATLEEVQEWIRNKPEACSCCSKKRKLVLDHDHKTGKIRGWVCILCNISLGQIEQPKQHLLEYLQRSK